MAEALEIRLTHKYVGEYRHLDDWKSVGRYEVLAEGTFSEEEDEDDPCEPMETIKLVEVQTYEPETAKLICEALATSNTAWGCAHEWDCCGCRSYRATAEHLKGNRYQLNIYSSRNY